MSLFDKKKKSTGRKPGFNKGSDGGKFVEAPPVIPPTPTAAPRIIKPVVQGIDTSGTIVGSSFVNYPLHRKSARGFQRSVPMRDGSTGKFMGSIGANKAPKITEEERLAIEARTKAEQEAHDRETAENKEKHDREVAQAREVELLRLRRQVWDMAKQQVADNQPIWLGATAKQRAGSASREVLNLMAEQQDAHEYQMREQGDQDSRLGSVITGIRLTLESTPAYSQKYAITVYGEPKDEFPTDFSGSTVEALFKEIGTFTHVRAIKNSKTGETGILVGDDKNGESEQFIPDRLISALGWEL